MERSIKPLESSKMCSLCHKPIKKYVTYLGNDGKWKEIPICPDCYNQNQGFVINYITNQERPL